MRTHSGEKPYKCSECNYAAAWKVQLKDHMKAHSQPNAAICGECQILFKDIRALKTHETKEHGLLPQRTVSVTVVKDVKEEMEPPSNQIIIPPLPVDTVNNVTYAVPQSYAQSVNFTNPFATTHHVPYNIAQFHQLLSNN